MAGERRRLVGVHQGAQPLDPAQPVRIVSDEVHRRAQSERRADSFQPVAGGAVEMGSDLAVHARMIRIEPDPFVALQQGRR